MFYRFLREDSGAVTVDWVLITAAVVGFGIAATSLLLEETFALTETVSEAIANEQN